jgi:hypothetical protein
MDDVTKVEREWIRMTSQSIGDEGRGWVSRDRIVVC